MSKVSQDCVGFALLHSIIVSSSQPIRSKTIANGTLTTRVFARFGQFSCFTLSFHWLLVRVIYFLTGRCNFLLLYPIFQRLPFRITCQELHNKRKGSVGRNLSKKRMVKNPYESRKHRRCFLSSLQQISTEHSCICV